MDYALDHFAARNSLAEQVIAEYAMKHAAMDVVIGIAGTFIPFGGIGAMLVSLAAQAPVVYQPLVKDLAKIYSASADEFTQKVINKAAIIGAVGDIGSEILGASLASEFGQEFLLEILHELWPELGLGAVVGALPIIGGVVSAGLDATLAATLTWRVGITTALYFFNGEEWPGGNKKKAYDIAKRKTGTPSPVPSRPGTIGEDLLRKDQAMWEKNVRAVIQIIRSMKKANSALSKDEMRSLLKEDGYPEGVIEEALRRV